MFCSRDSRLTRFALVVFFTVAILYALFEARGQILGPSIDISGVPPVAHDPFIRIKGIASRISSLSMNGGDINVTQEGNFDEPYLLAPGYNRIVFDAKDSYGRTSERAVEITYLPAEASSTPAIPASATSSPPSASSTVPIAPTS